MAGFATDSYSLDRVACLAYTEIVMEKNGKILVDKNEWRRLKDLDNREVKMKPLILQLASFMRRKKGALSK